MRHRIILPTGSRVIARALLVVAVAALMTGNASAQVDDHLECYKIKDSIAYKAVVDLVTQEFGAASGCTVQVKGAMLCTPVTKQVTQTDAPVLTYDGQQLTDDRICYKVKCPKVALPDQDVVDQFGTRTLSKFSPKIICTPADIQ